MRPSTRIALSLIVSGALLAPAVGALAAPRTAASTALVKTTAAHILVNAQGMSLYVFAPDKPSKSTCYGKCATYWPPAIVPSGTKVPATMPGIKGKFGVAMRTDGSHQLTFDGAPLYTFLEDKKAGDMNGQGLDAAGGYWWLVVVGA